jgi:hypothetical protein
VASDPGLERRRTYAEWYVWAARNVSSTAEIRHACAEAATEAVATGADPAAAARSAAQNRSGPGWTTRAEPGIRSYAEWYDWTRTDLGLSGEPLHAGAAAAIAAMETGGDVAAAAAAVRQAVGTEGDPGTSTTAGPTAAPFNAPPQPAPFMAAPSTPSIPPPPPPMSAPAPGYPSQVPPSPAPYAYAGAPYPAPPPTRQGGSAQVPIWVTVLLGIGCGISVLIAIVYIVGILAGDNTQDVVIFASVIIGLALAMFGCSLAALIGVIMRAGWARVMAIVAGGVFCLSCAGIVFGVPIIIGAATARRAEARSY